MNSARGRRTAMLRRWALKKLTSFHVGQVKNKRGSTPDASPGDEHERRATNTNNDQRTTSMTRSPRSRRSSSVSWTEVKNGRVVSQALTVGRTRTHTSIRTRPSRDLFVDDRRILSWTRVEFEAYSAARESLPQAGVVGVTGGDWHELMVCRVLVCRLSFGCSWRCHGNGLRLRARPRRMWRSRTSRSCW